MPTNEQIGLKIQQQRTAKGLTLRGLAEKSGLSPAFISQIEHGKVGASLDSLRSVAEVLEVPMFYFFTSDNLPASVLALPGNQKPDRSDPEEEEYSPVVRSYNRPRLTLPFSDSLYELLSIDAARKMEAFIARLGPGQHYQVRRLRQPTEEIIFVLSGALRLGLQDQTHVLYAGDAIYFDGEKLSSMDCASSDQEAVWLSVITPPMF
jgi:transcriptional regulator with XRE-family HTH domain